MDGYKYRVSIQVQIGTPIPHTASVQRQAARFPEDLCLTIDYQRSTNVSLLIDEPNWSSMKEREEH